MNITLTLFTVLLFVLLTPGILLRLPKNGNKWTVAFVHGLVFALVFHFSQKFVWTLSASIEGNTNMNDASGALPNTTPLPQHHP
jgi:hypothetical protein